MKLFCTYLHTFFPHYCSHVINFLKNLNCFKLFSDISINRIYVGSPAEDGLYHPPCFFFAVPESVLSHNKVRSKSAEQLIFCAAPGCPRGSLFPYKSEENHFYPRIVGPGVIIINRPGVAGAVLQTPFSLTD